MGCELILALDVPDRSAALKILDRAAGNLSWVKIGLQMFTAHGPAWIDEVSSRGFQIFLDLKLHDIPNTVARAVDSLVPLPIGMLTVHACGGREMMEAAQERCRADLTLLAVTVLTSMDAAGLSAIGVNAGPAAQAARLAALAKSAGIGGLVCSPLELSDLRAPCAGMKLVTPGIRPAAPGKDDDQKRVATPRAAAVAGADFIVVGRPILEAADPGAAAARIREAISDPCPAPP